MATSLEAGKRVTLDRVGLFADGAAVRLVGRETFRICNALLDGVIRVTNDEICAAIKTGFNDTRCVLEPAGALALAGVRKYASEKDVAGQIFVAIASGANMDFDRLRFVSERADQSEVRLSVKIPERPGAFRELYEQIHPCNVTEFSYRYNRASSADIILSFQPRTNAWFTRLTNHGYEPRDITGDDFVKNHLRHLAGGHAPFGPKERVFRFDFPEAPGALHNFLLALDGDKSGFNCSLFHYRNYGHDFGRVLVGLHVPPHKDSEKKFDKFLSTVGYHYVEETNNPSYTQFLAP